MQIQRSREIIILRKSNWSLPSWFKTNISNFSRETKYAPLLTLLHVFPPDRSAMAGLAARKLDCKFQRRTPFTPMYSTPLEAGLVMEALRDRKPCFLNQLHSSRTTSSLQYYEEQCSHMPKTPRRQGPGRQDQKGYTPQAQGSWPHAAFNSS